MRRRELLFPLKIPDLSVLRWSGSPLLAEERAAILALGRALPLNAVAVGELARTRTADATMRAVRLRLSIRLMAKGIAMHHSARSNAGFRRRCYSETSPASRPPRINLSFRCPSVSSLTCWLPVAERFHSASLRVLLLLSASLLVLGGPSALEFQVENRKIRGLSRRRPFTQRGNMQSITALALLLAATTFADASRASSWRHPSLLRRSFRRLNHPRRTTSTFDDTSSTTAAAPGSTRSGIGGRAPSPLHSAVFCTRGGDGGNGPCIGIDLGESRLPSRCNLNFSSSRSRFRSGVYV